MSFGLNITNNDGYVLLDDSYARYSVVQEGTANTANLLSYPTQTTIPLILVRPPNGRWITIFNSSWPISLSSVRFIFGQMDSAAGHFDYDYVVLKRMDEVSNQSGYGLNIYNAVGTQIFSSQLSQSALDLSIVWTITQTETTYSLNVPPYGDRYILGNGLGFSGASTTSTHLISEQIEAKKDSESSITVRNSQNAVYIGAPTPNLYSSMGKHFNFCAGYH